MKYFLSFSIFLCIQSFAQDYKYETDLYYNILIPFPKYAPKSPTSVSPIRFMHPATGNLSGIFKVLLNNKNTIGISLAYDGYDFGYSLNEPSNNISVGVAGGGGNFFCYMFKGGIYYQRLLIIHNHFSLNANCNLLVGKPIFLKYFTDTSINNSGFRNPEHPWYVQHIRQPPYYTDNIVPLINVGLTGSYKIKERYSLNLGCTYQQGFKTIAIDYTSIEIPSENRKALYSAKFNGTAIMASIGMSYKFGKKK